MKEEIKIIYVSTEKKKKKSSLGMFKLQLYFLKHHGKDESSPNHHICHCGLQINFIEGEILLKIYHLHLAAFWKLFKNQCMSL